MLGKYKNKVKKAHAIIMTFSFAFLFCVPFIHVYASAVRTGEVVTTAVVVHAVG